MHMQTRIALPLAAAVLAAAIAVPALAGGSPSHRHRSATAHRSASAHRAAKRHRARRPRPVCVSKAAGRRRLTLCASAGPAGPRGYRGRRGFVGPHGPRGYRGPKGAAGATGPTGATGVPGPRAAALISPAGVGEAASASGLLDDTGILSVRRLPSPRKGIYCVAASPPLEPASAVAVVSGEAGYSAPEVTVPMAVLEAKHAECQANEFEVKTYAVTAEASAPAASNSVAFTIAVP